MHYAVPRALHSHNLLERLFTDAVSPVVNRRLGDLLFSLGIGRWNLLRKWLDRQPTGIPREKVTAFQCLGIDYALRLRLARNREQSLRAFLWAGRAFGHKVISTELRNAEAVYVYNSAGLEILQYAGRRGLFRALEQTIVPIAVERELLAHEHARWPDWEHADASGEMTQEYAERELQEWRNADLVLCGSQFVIDGISACGGPWDKCLVVPYGVEPLPLHACSVPSRKNLNVLFMGTVCLRKGIPYLYRAASLLSKTRFHIRVVGPSVLTRDAQSELSRAVDVFGPVPRSQTIDHYGWADILVLPSICEGSATVSYEALSAGIPVIATASAGTVVRDGIDGFIIPSRDPEAIASRLELLARDRVLLDQMRHQARARAVEYSLDRYGANLVAALECRWPALRGRSCPV
jgi:glycosyltransferase involved in cell wall biosynthesis